MRQLLLLVLFTAACDRPATPVEPQGTLSVTWAGVTAGSLSAPATASWCAPDSLLEVVAVRGDTGVGFSLLVEDTVRVAQYPVLSGAMAVDWRPLAMAALRWASDTALHGFEGNDGKVEVTGASEGTVAGTLDLMLRVNDGTDTLRMTGEFRNVPIRPATGACGRISKVRIG